MILLANGCRCSEPKISPANWQDAGANLNVEWSLHYRFYSPQKPQGQQIRIRGMAAYKTLADRRAYAKSLLENEKEMLLKRNYNPITGYILEEDHLFAAFDEEFGNTSIDPEMPYIQALTKAMENCEQTPKVKANIKSVLKYYAKAAKMMNVHNAPISKIEKKHVKVLLDKCKDVKKTFSNNTYNYYKSHLSMLYNYLVEERVIPENFIRTLPEREHTPKRRIAPTDEERRLIDNHLRKNHFMFWMVMNLFYHSGARNTEFIKLKKEDVEMVPQRIWYGVNKGKKRRVCRPLKDIVLPYWQIIVSKAEPGQYLFSRGWSPGENHLQPDRLTRCWEEYVKDELGINVDWYTLKHLNSTETKSELGAQLAAMMNQHSERVLNEHYDLLAEEREKKKMEYQHSLLRKVNNSFAVPGTINDK